jgi:hypothetical protein
MPVKVAIADYGVGNLHSIRKALENCGASPCVVDNMRKLLKDHGFSASSFRRYWARRFPVSPTRFVLSVRMHEACRLLAETALTVKEIAERTAQATAGQLFGAISQNNGQVNSALAQIKQMVGGQSNDPFSQVVSMLQSMQQMSQMFGMPLPGMMPGAPQGGGLTGGQPPSDPPPIEKHTAKEWEDRNV